MTARRLLFSIRLLILAFMVGLVASGITAIPLVHEVAMLKRWVHAPLLAPVVWPGLLAWIDTVHQGVTQGYGAYPFLAYGTDWLAFGHFAIALAFIGPLRDPVRNIWVIEFGMLICLLVIPMALIMGPIRGIPFFWQLIDSSFGVIGVVPLWLSWRMTKQLAATA
jgi:hypothetical protein